MNEIDLVTAGELIELARIQRGATDQPAGGVDSTALPKPESEMTQGELQRKFAGMVGMLITRIYRNGYACTFGDAFRSVEQARQNSLDGTGIANSLHCIRLAIDLNLFRDGVYLTKTEDYQGVGEWWESIGGSWGGRFERPDADHFSLAYGGRK